MIRQRRFISFNKCTTLVRDVDKRGGYACGEGIGVIREILSSQFHCEYTSAGEYKAY